MPPYFNERNLRDTRESIFGKRKRAGKKKRMGGTEEKGEKRKEGWPATSSPREAKTAVERVRKKRKNRWYTIS